MAFQIDEPCQPCQPIEVVLLALFKFWSNQVLGNAKNQVLCCWELIVQTVIFYFFSGVCLDGWYPYFSFRNYAPSLKVLVKQHDHFCIIVVDLMDGIHWHTLIVFVRLFFSLFFFNWKSPYYFSIHLLYRKTQHPNKSWLLKQTLTQHLLQLTNSSPSSSSPHPYSLFLPLYFNCEHLKPHVQQALIGIWNRSGQANCLMPTP